MEKAIYYLEPPFSITTDMYCTAHTISHSIKPWDHPCWHVLHCPYYIPLHKALRPPMLTCRGVIHGWICFPFPVNTLPNTSKTINILTLYVYHSADQFSKLLKNGLWFLENHFHGKHVWCAWNSQMYLFFTTNHIAVFTRDLAWRVWPTCDIFSCQKNLKCVPICRCI